MNKDSEALIKKLQEPTTIRSQSRRILDLAKADQLRHFHLDPEKMTSTASYVIEVITNQYPDLQVPYHSRWRHFEAQQIDRIQLLKQRLTSKSPTEIGKILFELVIISVFLDAGAGSNWRYKEAATAQEFNRSEGLALASLDLYQQGAFSAFADDPFRVDAKALIAFNYKNLQQGFQITPDNPLEGTQGRISLLNQLGLALQSNTHYFGNEGRLGDFYSHILSLETNNCIDTPAIFKAVLNAFNPIWPTRLSIDGYSLGDVWTHQSLKTTEAGSEYIPFHKLSQWLTYSLLEPLEQTGIKITGIDALTGLPEYRNGGLLIDTGLLSVKDSAALVTAQNPGSELVVEWRALTVALLDDLAELIRQKLHCDSTTLPLAKILQGGTWEAGRRIAREKRAQGLPPLQIISDGTVF